MAGNESTAITNLIHMMSSRPLEPVARDSEPTMLVQRTQMPQMAYVYRQPPMVQAQAQPQADQLSAAVVMITALAIGILSGIAVAFV